MDIIYPSGPEGEFRIMYELETYENYLGRDGQCPLHPQPEEGLVWVEVCSCVPSQEHVQPKWRKNSSRPAGTPYMSKCGLSSQSQGGV